MKTFNKTSLPVSVQYNGHEYKCDHSLSASVTLGQALPPKSGYIQVNVMSRALRGKLDLHSKPYTPTVWYYSKAI